MAQANKQRVKEPEKLDLPEQANVAIPEKSFHEPYFSILEKEKVQLKQSFDISRHNARLERIKKIQQIRNSKLIVYYSIDILSRNDAEILYDLLQSVTVQENLDLFLLSPGGFADPAFKMSTLCREFAKSKWSVIIPHYAKSAATLLSLGCDELVMGHASEIGPTDPRIEIVDEYGRKMNVSATSVEDALKVIEENTNNDPNKSLKYIPLIEKINLNTLGEYRRALTSSQQYAESSLQTGKLLKDKTKVKEVASKLATNYFSHGYPINRVMAENELGFNVVKAEGDLWDSIWQLYKLYDAMIKESRNGSSMITTIFEAEEFSMPIIKNIQNNE